MELATGAAGDVVAPKSTLVGKDPEKLGESRDPTSLVEAPALGVAEGVAAGLIEGLAAGWVEGPVAEWTEGPEGPAVGLVGGPAAK